jgi:ATP-dependent RNA helicase DDX5/DBP2
MAGRRPSGHALTKAAGKGKRPPPPQRDRGPSKRRPAASGSDSDASDESPLARRKKKKRRKAPAAEAPSKLQLLPPRQWEGVRLPPMVREVRPADAGGPVAQAEVEAVRRRLRLRVPTQRRRPCAFWLKGECRRGSSCAFLHAGPEDASATPPQADCPPPILSLGDPTLPRFIGRAMLGLGLPAPSAVQSQAWPVALAGRDLLCRAPTGSGKTLAYLLPAVAHSAVQPRPPRPGAGPQVLILVPTRELAVQTLSVARGVRRAGGGGVPAPVAIYGGGPRDEQLAALEGAVGICIATTGRLLDLLGEKAVGMGQATMLVLDEADAMLALGFEAQV